MKTEKREFTFELGEKSYQVELRIKGGHKSDLTYRGIILDITSNYQHLVRYTRYTDGSSSLEIKPRRNLFVINSWKEAKGIILNYILNGSSNNKA